VIAGIFKTQERERTMSQARPSMIIKLVTGCYTVLYFTPHLT
jgi:hypothetical protein